MKKGSALRHPTADDDEDSPPGSRAGSGISIPVRLARVSNSYAKAGTDADDVS
jgi:hypothetical protein